MPENRYRWTGRDRLGHEVRGEQSASSEDDLIAQLRRQRIRVTRLTPSAKQRVALFQHRVQPREITAFSRQLTTLLRAGVPMLQALQILQRGLGPSAMHDLLCSLHSQVESGLTLSQSMQQHRAFDAMFCNLVAAGESGGVLDTLLERLTTHREKTEALRRTVRTALLYPGLVLAIALGVTVALLTWVIPVFDDVFSSMGTELPPLTQGILHLSRQWRQYGVEILSIGALCILASVQLLRRHAGLQAVWQAMWLRFPLIGRLIQQACMARWCRALSTLCAAGVPITEALQATAGVTGHLEFQKATQLVHQYILQGQTLSQALSRFDLLFSPLLVQMTAIGEESGTLEQMLDRMALHHESELDTAAARLAALLEPAMLAILGLLMGGLVLALYGPMFQMGQAL